MNKTLILAALSAAIVATPALAQTATAPVGPRVEALVGYDSVKALGESDDGVVYGVGAGYDFAVSNGVSLGVDVEATDSTQKYGNDNVYVKSGRDLYAGARANFAISDRANIYVKGGYTNARFKASDGINSAADNADGWRLGAGTQYILKGKTYVGGEYRFSNYEGGDVKRHQVAMTLGTRF
nr:porin family protein [uncultured Sphingomonas sp.]